MPRQSCQRSNRFLGQARLRRTTRQGPKECLRSGATDSFQDLGGSKGPDSIRGANNARERQEVFDPTTFFERESGLQLLLQRPLGLFFEVCQLPGSRLPR